MPIEKQPLGTYALRPAAAPVSTYVRPAEVRPDTSTQLAAALRDVQPTLQKYLGEAADKQAKETTDRAEKMALVQQVKSYQEAVDKGLLKPGESDLFVRVYEEQRGRVLALEQRNRAFQAYESWEDKDAAVNGDPEAPAKFGNFLTDLAGSSFGDAPNDNVQRGMKAGVESTLREISSLHGQRTANLVQQKYEDEIGKEIGLLLDSEIVGTEKALREWSAGDKSTPMPSFDPARMGQRLNELKNTARAMRVPGQKINEIVVEAVVSSAVRRAQMGDPYSQEYLTVAMQDWVDPATGKTVPGPASTNAGRLALEQAQSRVVTEYQQWEAHQAKLEKDRKEAAKDAWLGENLPLIFRDRQPPSTAQLQRLGQLFGPEAVKDVMGAVSTGRTIADYDSAGTVGAAWSDLIMGRVDAAGAIRHISRFRDPDTQQRFFDDYARLTDLGGGSASKGATLLRSDPVFGPYVKGMDKLIETNDDPLGIAKLFPPKGMERADAMAGFQSDILDYAAKNPDASRADKRKFMRELSGDYEQQVKTLYEQAGAPKRAPAEEADPYANTPER
jgi:hypothetical protein